MHLCCADFFGHVNVVDQAIERYYGPVHERMTYDDLVRASEPNRGIRAMRIKLPPMEVDSYQTNSHFVFSYYFNAKGKPSTTGLRHQGYVRFMKPKNRKSVPLARLDVEVDCMCPDYRYRWAWANKQRQAGRVGPNSLNQALNRAPRITNPRGKPGLCKHILATRQFIYDLLSGFPKKGPMDSERLDRLTRRATKRWINIDAEMQAARERDARIAATRAQRNIGVPPERQGPPPTYLAAKKPEPLPSEEPEETAEKVPELPPGGSTKGAERARAAGFETPAEFNAARSIGDSAEKNQLMRVCNMTNMKTLSLQETQVVDDARKIILEMEDELANAEPEMPPADGSSMPVEPPISDNAIGASTEDNVALGLLREIRDLLAALVTDEEGDLEEPPLPGEGEGEAINDKIDAEADALEAEDEDENFRPGKRPMPVPSGA